MSSDPGSIPGTSTKTSKARHVRAFDVGTERAVVAAGRCYSRTMPTEKQVRKAARDCSLIFTALGDPNRQDILIMLEQHGPLNVLQITEKLHLARPTVSHHLKVLLNAGLLTSTKKSRETFYESVWEDPLKRLNRFMELISC